ncbi:MAG: HIT family protein, partial [Acidimicrobiia bacterium]
MASVFTMIINGDLPGHFVWRDETAVAFMSINPINTGHTLVVPVAEVDHWVDLPSSTTAHLMDLAQRVARSQQEVLSPTRVGLMIAGFEVPHTHVHVIPMESMDHLSFANSATDVDHEQLADLASRLSQG